MNRNLNVRDGFSPLHIAASSGRLDIVKTFLSQGQNQNVKDKDGQDLFHIAVIARNIAMVKSLVEHGLRLALWH
jgi:ankyrin repeat protein